MPACLNCVHKQDISAAVCMYKITNEIELLFHAVDNLIQIKYCHAGKKQLLDSKNAELYFAENNSLLTLQFYGMFVFIVQYTVVSLVSFRLQAGHLY